MTDQQVKQMLLQKLKHISMDSEMKGDSIEELLERVREVHLTVTKCLTGPKWLATTLQEKLNKI